MCREVRNSKTYELREQKTLEKFSRMKRIVKHLTASGTIHGQGVCDPNYFDNETVRKNYCKLLNTYVRSKHKEFPDKALFLKSVAPTKLVTLNVLFWHRFSIKIGYESKGRQQGSIIHQISCLLTILHVDMLNNRY